METTTRNKTEQISVLYIDDMQTNLKLISMVLSREYLVFQAETIEEAENILQNNTIQVLITDQSMPEMSGMEFIQQIKDLYPEMKKFIISGYSNSEEIQEAIDSHLIEGFIQKPVDFTLLKVVLKKAVSERN